MFLKLIMAYELQPALLFPHTLLHEDFMNAILEAEGVLRVYC
jgi:hypothetical protein